MRFVPVYISVLLLAGGAGWSAFLVKDLRRADVCIAVLGIVLALAVLAYFATGRKEKGAWIRFGLYGAAMMICAASIWMEIVRPVLAVTSFRGFAGWVTHLAGYELASVAVAPVGFAITFMLWFEVLIDSLKYLSGGNRRQRAESDLYGRSKLLGRRFLRRLAKRRGILLGQWGAGRNAKLIGWSLEGSAITVAPPRVGKGALIALNLLSPGYRGFQGSTVTIDPRGELWCIAARRRRELGRRALLIDPFGVVAQHKEQFEEKTHLPNVRSAFYNPLDFIRDDKSLAVRDINVLLDALLTPPRPGSHESSRHFYESARAIVAGYMAWVRFKELPELRTLAKVYEMLSMSPKQRETFADRVRDTDRFVGGLNRQGVMPRGGLKESADGVRRFGRLEGDRGSMGRGGAVVRDDMRRIAAKEMSGLQNQAVAWAWVPAGDAPAQRASPARESEKPEPGGVLRLGDAVLPVALAEGQQDCGIGDPHAVIGEGNAGDIAILFDGRGDAVGAATA